MKSDPFDPNRAALRKPKKPVKMADGGMVDGLDHGQRSRNSGLSLDKIEFDADTKMMNAQVRRANADTARNYKMAVLAKSKARMAEPATQEGMLSSIGRKAKAFFAADGGMVEGPGGPTDDMIPAMYSAGEYVLPADTVQAVGKENLDSLRRMTHTKAKHKSKVKGGVLHAADGGSWYNSKLPDINERDNPTAFAARQARLAREAANKSVSDAMGSINAGASNSYASTAAPAADPAVADGLYKKLAAGGTAGYTLPGALKPTERENPYNKSGNQLMSGVKTNPDMKDWPGMAKTLEYNGPSMLDDSPRDIQAAQTTATNSSGETEAERKGQLSEIDSQLFGLRGNVNMASKRQMVTNLLGVKRQLTSDRIGQLSDADKLATGVSSDNAGRRQGADQFNTGTKLDVEKFNVGARNENSEGLRRSQSEMAKLAAANDPNSLDNQLKMRADARAQSASEFAGDSALLEREARLNKYSNEQITGIAKAEGIPFEQAAAKYSAMQSAAGRPDTTTTGGVVGTEENQKWVDNLVSSRANEGGTWYDPIEKVTSKLSRKNLSGVDPEDVLVDRSYDFGNEGLLGLAKRAGNAVGMNNRTVNLYAKTEGDGAQSSLVTEDQAVELERRVKEDARNKKLTKAVELERRKEEARQKGSE